MLPSSSKYLVTHSKPYSKKICSDIPSFPLARLKLFVQIHSHSYPVVVWCILNVPAPASSSSIQIFGMRFTPGLNNRSIVATSAIHDQVNVSLLQTSL